MGSRIPIQRNATVRLHRAFRQRKLIRQGSYDFIRSGKSRPIYRLRAISIPISRTALLSQTVERGNARSLGSVHEAFPPCRAGSSAAMGRSAEGSEGNSAKTFSLVWSSPQMRARVTCILASMREINSLNGGIRLLFGIKQADAYCFETAWLRSSENLFHAAGQIPSRSNRTAMTCALTPNFAAVHFEKSENINGDAFLP